MGFVELLKTSKNARKIFGERELKIIEKQLLGISLTQSEKNRLSRDIRKKFEFMKEASNFAEEFKLKKGAIINKIIEETKEIIMNDSYSRKIKRIILYGSVVEKKFTFKSDIDIAVEFSDINLKDATIFRKRISAELNPKVDIQVYNYLPDKIKKEIELKRKILYETKN